MTRWCRQPWLSWWIGGLAWLLVLAFGEPAWRRLWMTTLELGLAAALVGMSIGGWLSRAIDRLAPPYRVAGRAAVAAWALMPLYVQAAAWRPVFEWLRRFILPPVIEPAGPAAWACTWWIHGAAAIPWCTIIFQVVMASVPASWTDQIRLTERPFAARWQALRSFRLIAVTASAVWVMVVVATDITVTDLYRIPTLAEAIYLQFALHEVPAVAGLHWEELLLIGGLAAMASAAMHHVVPLIGRPETSQPADGAPDRGSALVVAGVLSLGIGLPMLGLAYTAGLHPVVMEGGGRGIAWSGMKWWGLMTGWGPFGDSFALARLTSGTTWYDSEWYWSLVISAASASIAWCIALSLAVMATAGGRRTLMTAAAIAVMLAVPSPQWGIWIVELFSHARHPWLIALYDRTILAPVLASVLRSVPIVTLLLWGVFRTIPPGWFDQARLLGRGRWWTVVRLVVPARWPLLCAAWYLGAAIAFGDIGATQPVLPPGMPTVTWRIFDLLHAGVDDVVAAFCWWLAVGSFGVAFAVILSVTRATRPVRRGGEPS